MRKQCCAYYKNSKHGEVYKPRFLYLAAMLMVWTVGAGSARPHNVVLLFRAYLSL
jgi:hypothetical protein